MDCQSFSDQRISFLTFLEKEIPKDRVALIPILVTGDERTRRIVAEELATYLFKYHGWKKTNLVFSDTKFEILSYYAPLGERSLNWRAKKPIQIWVFDGCRKLGDREKAIFEHLEKYTEKQIGSGLIFLFILGNINFYRLDPVFRRKGVFWICTNGYTLDKYYNDSIKRQFGRQGKAFLGRRKISCPEEEKGVALLSDEFGKSVRLSWYREIEPPYFWKLKYNQVGELVAVRKKGIVKE